MEGKVRRGREKGSGSQETEHLEKDRVAGNSRDTSRTSQKSRRKNANQGTSRNSSSHDVSRAGKGTKESRSPEQSEGGASVSNTEMAQAMTARATGTRFEIPTKEQDKVRTMKQSKMSRRGPVTASGNASASMESSTGTTADADEESASFSTNSPVPEAVTPPTDSTGVSDMLEPPAPAAQVLRLTGPVQTERSPRPAAKSSTQEPLTKKQRQRKAKNEARKAERAESEQERMQKLEKQRRTAREAEGRAPRDGGGWTYNSGKPAPSAWSGKPVQEEQASAGAVSAPLLDTFERHVNGSVADQESQAVSAPASHSTERRHISADVAPRGPENVRPPNGQAVAEWEQGLPNEETQMKLLRAQEDADQWTTVANKKSSRKVKVPTAEDERSS